MFCGGALVCALIIALFGTAAGFFYLAGLVAGPSIYAHRWPWEL